MLSFRLSVPSINILGGGGGRKLLAAVKFFLYNTHMTSNITIHKEKNSGAGMVTSLAHVTALQIRQSFGKILKKLKKEGEPILVEKGRQPVAVLISLEDFQEHFIDYREKKKREALLELMKTSVKKSKEDSLTILRELRYGADH